MAEWDVVSEAPASAPASDPWTVVDQTPAPVQQQNFDQRWEPVSEAPAAGAPKSTMWSRFVEVLQKHASGARDIVAAPGRALALPERDLNTEEGQFLANVERDKLIDDTIGLGTSMLRLNKLPVSGRTAGMTPYGVGDRPPQGATPVSPAAVPDSLPATPVAAPVQPPAGLPPATPPPAGAPPVPPVQPPPVAATVPPVRPPPRGPTAPPLTPDDTAILERVGRQPNARPDLDPYTNLVDDLNPIRRAVEQEQRRTTGSTAGVAAVDDPYVQFRLTRGSAGKAEHMLRHGVLDFNSLAKTGDALEPVLKAVRGERDQFTAYLMARRAIELDARGIDTGIPLAEAQRVAAAASPRYQSLARRVDDYQDATLRYARDSGLISAEAYTNMRATGQNYIPLNRAIDPKRDPKRFNVANPIKRLQGSEEKILDPIDSVIRNTYAIAEMAERNRAAKTLVGFANGQLATKVQAPVRPTHVTAGEFAQAMDDHGIPPGLIGQPAGFDVLRKDLHAGLKADEFALFENGKRQVYKTDEKIAAAIKNMDQLDLGLADTLMAPFAKVLRAGVTADPGYMARNIIRDQISAALQSKYNYRPGYDFVKGVWERARKGESYQDFLKSGATQSTLVAQDRNYATPFLRNYGAARTPWQHFKDTVGKPVEVLQDISETVDNATRLGEFMRATKGRRDKAAVMEGGIAGRDVTQDFQRIGAKIRGWNRIIPFMNGQVQGLDRELSTIGKAAMSPKKAATYAAKLATLVTLPSIYLWIANKDDKRYQNAPDWEKDQYWLIMPENPDAEPIRIPKGFTLGMIGGSAPERILDSYFKDKPQEYDKFAKRILGTMAPNVIPTAILPAIEQFANKSNFMGTPIVGAREQQLTAERHAGPGTSDTARLLARGLSNVPGVSMEKVGLASPKIVDNYIRQWGGTLGRYGTMAVDKGLQALGAVDKRAPSPESKLSDIPVIRTFISKYPSAGAQPIQDFYEKHDKIEKAFNTARVDQRAGKGEPPAVTRVIGYKRQMDAMHKTVRDTWEDKDMTPREKREIIDQTYLRMLQTAQEGLAVIRAAGSIAKQNYGGPQ